MSASNHGSETVGNAPMVWIADPEMPWTAPPAYAVLNERLTRQGHAPLGPQSTTAEVNDSFFDLMGGDGPSTAERNAWSALRTTAQRLVIDFFHYRLPEFAPHASDAYRFDYPVLEVGLADIARLAVVPLDLAAVWQRPSRIEPDDLYPLANHGAASAAGWPAEPLDTLPSSLPSLEAILESAA